mmetsp:Transcript_43316/g.112616  ORF Transcript_43316/g.112616 Transcript_43316/m.112616 type:complete len:526 (+) Transcript_43316:758-2335(+)
MKLLQLRQGRGGDQKELPLSPTHLRGQVGNTWKFEGSEAVAENKEVSHHRKGKGRGRCRRCRRGRRGRGGHLLQRNKAIVDGGKHTRPLQGAGRQGKRKQRDGGVGEQPPSFFYIYNVTKRCLEKNAFGRWWSPLLGIPGICFVADLTLGRDSANLLAGKALVGSAAPKGRIECCAVWERSDGNQFVLFAPVQQRAKALYGPLKGFCPGRIGLTSTKATQMFYLRAKLENRVVKRLPEQLCGTAMSQKRTELVADIRVMQLLEKREEGLVSLGLGGTQGKKACRSHHPHVQHLVPTFQIFPFFIDVHAVEGVVSKRGEVHVEVDVLAQRHDSKIDDSGDQPSLLPWKEKDIFGLDIVVNHVVPTQQSKDLGSREWDAEQQVFPGLLPGGSAILGHVIFEEGGFATHVVERENGTFQEKDSDRDGVVLGKEQLLLLFRKMGVPRCDGTGKGALRTRDSVAMGHARDMMGKQDFGHGTSKASHYFFLVLIVITGKQLGHHSGTVRLTHTSVGPLSDGPVQEKGLGKG